MEKKGLLVVSFGTSHAHTRKKNIEHLERLLADAFPDRIFYHAYTSGMILKVLRERDAIYIPSVSEAMKQIVSDGVRDLLVQPTHVMNGIENEQMKSDILEWKDLFSSLAFGDPLLTSASDYTDVIEALMKELPVPGHQEALMLMGHGSPHYANSVYAALDYAFKHQGFPQVHVGTVEAYPDLDTILSDLETAGIRRVYLAPLMLVAGDHATSDLAGDEKDSWKSVLESHGMETVCILKGLGEYPGICDLYLKHAGQALL